MKKIFSFILLGLMCSIGTMWADTYYYGCMNLTNGALTPGTTSTIQFVKGGATLSSSTDLSLTNTPSTTGMYYNSTDLSSSELSKSANWGTSSSSSRTIRGLKFANGTEYTLSLGSREASSITFYGWCGSASKTLTIGGIAYGTPGKKNQFFTNEFTKSGNFTGNVTISQDGDCYGILVIVTVPTAPTITTDLDATADVQVGNAQEFSIVASDALSYQWYSNTTNSTEGATAIVGATSASYSYTAQAEGTVYLYCVATNAIGSTNSTICAVTATNPPAVTTASISGATSAYKGVGTTYTATAENATTFAWYVDGSVQAGQTSATFVYTPDAVGSHTIYCTATNAFTTTPIQSNTINVDVNTLYGEIIKATLTSGTAATVTGIVGGTADVSLSSSKKMDKGKYFGIQLANGTFHEGDTVNINITASSGGKVCLFEDKERTNCLYLGADKGVVGDNKIVLPAAANGITTLYVARDANDETYSWNPNLNFISVVRPMPIVSEAWESLTIDNGPTSYNRTGTVVNVVDAYLDPTVVVTKHVVYADATEANVDVEVTDLEVVGNQYVGHVTIGGDVYTINIAKLASYDVTYMDGEVVLGTEVVAANGHPAEFADYQNPQLATFGGWYRDANLTNQVANIASEIISANATYYAKYTKYYATSINIEKYALRSGKDSVKTVELVAQMGAQHYANNFAYKKGDNEIDYLNDSKENRNYAYLGLKIKKGGTMFDFRVAKNNTVKVKFGNVGATPLVSINGGAYTDMAITENVYSYTATVDALISIKTANASAVVLQQIAIGEELEASELEVEVTLGENGYSTFATDYKYTVEGAEVYKAAYNGSDAVTLTEVVDAVVPANAGIILKGTAGEIVTLTASGSAATELAGNGLVGVVAPLAATEGMYVLSTNAGVTEFNPCQAGVMIPAHKAYISIPSNAPAIRIIFAENGATGINELEGAEKAVKFIENGKLYIQKDGVVYDATGAKVK